jgi:AraC-like DNA-binding protein
MDKGTEKRGTKNNTICALHYTILTFLATFVQATKNDMKDTELPRFYLLNAGYATHHADWNYKNVSSPFARIYLVTDGEALLHTSGGGSISLTPGHLYLIPPFVRHSYECAGYYALYYIHIYETLSAGKLFFDDYIYPGEVKAGYYEIETVKKLLQINPNRELKQYDPKTYDNSSNLLHNIAIDSRNTLATVIHTSGILYQLLAAFAEHATEKYQATDNRIKSVLRLIRRDIDKEIPMDKMVEICCLSEAHFIRLFKKEIGLTPIQYILQKKIEKAQLLLLTTKQTVKDIAYSLSFDNIGYFDRTFKKMIGTTPGKYRENGGL